MKNHILVVEDEASIARLIVLELEHEGYQTTCIADGRDALVAATNGNYDLIILDVMLPSLNGIEILRRLRQVKSTPVIILTARDQIMDKVAGLDIGANDYMTKPFAIEELLARIRVNIRKVESNGQSYVFGKLVVNTDARVVSYDSQPIDLTKKEFDLLIYLLNNRNIVVTREQILDEVWGFDFYGNTNVVDVYIRYLRAKIDDVYKINLIQTVRGTGYVIRDN